MLVDHDCVYFHSLILCFLRVCADCQVPRAKESQCGVARQALMEKGREFESAFGARP